MSMLWRQIRKRAFTLIELLVVIAIIALLAAILVPSINNALIKASMTQTMENGRNIYVATYAKELDNIVVSSTTSIGWPKDKTADPVNGFATSTDYLKALVTNNIMNVSFDFFAAKGVTAYKGTDAALFTAANNAWCVVANLTDSFPETIPFLFTRNLNLPTELNDGKTDLRSKLNGAMTPYGTKGIAVTLKGGASFSLQEDQVTFANFNPSTSNAPVLRPGTSY